MAGTAPEVAAAFAEEQRRGLVLGTVVRLAALAVIAAWTLVENRLPGALYYLALTGAFAALGVGPLALRRAGVTGLWPAYLFAVLDVSLFTAAVLVPNPLDPLALPPQVFLRFGNELYLFLFLMTPLFTYTPGLVLWTGVAAAIAWSAGTLAILWRPESIGFIERTEWQGMNADTILAVILDPHRVDVGHWGRQVVLLLVMAGTLAAAVQRSRRLVERQVEAERARASLARYFSPNVVEELAGAGATLRATRQQDAAVLFVDLAGFTAFSATHAPAAVVTLLREFHRRVVGAVFAHGGTLNKFLGDGAMVTFGTPRPHPHAASDALACARTMLDSIAAWNAERAAQDEAPVRIGVGLHHGPVVIGDIGDERQLELAVVGTTVNVASRLQQITRRVDAAVVASDSLVATARAERGDRVLVGLVPLPPQEIRGHHEPLRVWALPAGA